MLIKELVYIAASLAVLSVTLFVVVNGECDSSYRRFKVTGSTSDLNKLNTLCRLLPFTYLATTSLLLQ
jgi:hypothetical protein